MVSPVSQTIEIGFEEKVLAPLGIEGSPEQSVEGPPQTVQAPQPFQQPDPKWELLRRMENSFRPPVILPGLDAIGHCPLYQVTQAPQRLTTTPRCCRSPIMARKNKLARL